MIKLVLQIMKLVKRNKVKFSVTLLFLLVALQELIRITFVFGSSNQEPFYQYVAIIIIIFIELWGWGYLGFAAIRWGLGTPDLESALYEKNGPDSGMNLWGKIRYFFRYPFLTILIPISVSWFLFTIVIPTFHEVFAGFGKELPPTVELVFTISNFLNEHYFVGALIVVLIGGSVIKTIRIRRALQKNRWLESTIILFSVIFMFAIFLSMFISPLFGFGNVVSE